MTLLGFHRRAKIAETMRVLLFGGHGMLGTDLGTELRSRGHDISAPPSTEANVTDPESVAGWISRGFDWVVNTAAYTAVDRAETEREAALTVNALGAGYVARACTTYGTRLIQMGSDFVFDGLKRTPYDEGDRTNPLGAYAESKRLGEEAVLTSGARALVVRTAWLFGPNGASFPRTIWRAAKAGRALRVVADQMGSPTYTGDLARVLVDLIELDPEPGIFHAAGPDPMTWHELAVQTLVAAGIDTPIEAIATDEWPTPAKRPPYSVLSGEKLASLGVRPMRPIQETLAEFVSRLDEP